MAAVPVTVVPPTIAVVVVMTAPAAVMAPTEMTAPVMATEATATTEPTAAGSTTTSADFDDVGCSLGQGNGWLGNSHGGRCWCLHANHQGDGRSN